MHKPKIFLLITIVFLVVASSKLPEREFYQIRVYHIKSDAQQKKIENFLEKAFLPAMKRTGISKIGVFRPVEPDTSARKIYVLIPFASLADITRTEEALQKDKAYLATGAAYIDTRYDDPSYERIESIILQAFSHHPRLQIPKLKGTRDERIYELRSYEGHSEKIFRNKVHMFNEGGEIALFERLGFNAVFYGEVISGSRMPNLMYMTTFENRASRDEHWKEFGSDPEWKKLSSMPEYQNNVSRIDIHFLRPAEYSDY
jgi:hypothetical protein